MGCEWTAVGRTMPRLWSSALLALAGLLLLGLGVYFMLLRPPLLPEDERYIGASLSRLEAAAPGISGWLRRVFLVMGGYILATGLLTVHLAAMWLRAGARGTLVASVLAGAASIGWMVVVNFTIDSDFKWLLLGFALPWAAAIGLAGAGK